MSVYIKNGITVLEDSSGQFVYETCIYLKHQNYFALCNKTYYASNIEIEGVIGSFSKNKNIQICSELFAAPKSWLIESGFNEYINPKKVKKLNN